MLIENIFGSIKFEIQSFNQYNNLKKKILYVYLININVLNYK